MLRRLDIQNLAIIDHLSIEFGPGLTVFTGETGAGKSILIGALTLVLGGRAQADLVRRGSESASVVAEFTPPEDPALRAQLQELGLDGESLLLRRVVQAEGRSRAFINDQPVTGATLAAIGARLVDISSQHQHQSLLLPEQHLALLDRAGTPAETLAAMRVAYAELAQTERQWRELTADERALSEREDFLRYQLAELNEARVSEGEDESLKEERERLLNADKWRQALLAADAALSGDAAALSELVRAQRELERLSGEPACAALAERLGAARIELDDIARETQALARRFRADPARLDAVEERLALLSRLLRKHGPTTHDLLVKAAQMREEWQRLEHLDDARRELEERLTRARAEAGRAADALHAVRTETARSLAARIEGELAGLGMKGAHFEIALRDKSARDGGLALADGRAVNAEGAEAAEFLLAANTGEAAKPLARVASGGELSRLMLALKSVLLDADPVPVSVFDEVDAGIGGQVAQEVGVKIRALSDARQVWCITHLPQIAAYADRHQWVAKRTAGGRTETRVTPLESEEARLDEIARMMAGAAAGEATRQAASELRAYARKSRARACGGRRNRLA